MNIETELIKKEIKENIRILINDKKLREAMNLIEEYAKIDSEDIEVYSMKSIVLILQDNMDEAEKIINKGLSIDAENFDLNYNLAYLYEKMGKFSYALKCYKKALENCNDEESKANIKNYIETISAEYSFADMKDRKKIAFFVKQGMDSFLGEIISRLEDEYETKKIIVTDYKQIDKGLEWADICWFEWCDELIAYGSRQYLSENKKIICRLHSYEAFAKYIDNVKWDNVDRIIFVGENIKRFVIDRYKIDERKMVIIPNGVNIEEYTFKERKSGFNIAYVGYINYKKGPMLLLHTFKAIYDKDHRYKLYIAGQFQDDRDVLYFQQMIKEFGIEKNVFYEGWQDNLDKWLEDKNYILCTSILESQNMSVMQAMAKGIKPIIHNFVGAKNIYDKKYVWNTIVDAIDILKDCDYDSKEYVGFIKNNYSIAKEIKCLKELLKSIDNKENNLKEKPLVTVGIINYNGNIYLEKCIESFLNQTYKSIEILLIDDCSDDGSKEIIEEYEKKYSNIRGIYHKVNSGGASKGIQDIIENAKGKYFQWIACDDFVEKNSVELFVEYLESNPKKDYIYSNFKIVDDNNIKTAEWTYNLPERNDVIRHIFHTASGIIPMNCMYRLEFFKRNNIGWLIYRGNDFSCDTLNTLHFIKYNLNYGKIDQSLINYRIHSNNLSNSLEKRINSLVSIFDYIIKNFSEEIYFQEVNWSEIANRKQFKNYLIANFYYEQIENNIEMKVIPNYLRGCVTSDDIKKYCSSLVKEGISYIKQGLRMGNSYKDELNDLNQKYSKYSK